MEISSIGNSMSFDYASMFNKLDTDGSGGITKDEFLANMKKMDGDTDEKLEQMFTETDTDGDGIISEAETQAALEKMAQNKPMQSPPPPPPAGSVSEPDSTDDYTSTTTTYDVRDTNKDGEVSLEEKLDYILRLIQEKEEADSATNQYNATGEATESSSTVSTTFSVIA